MREDLTDGLSIKRRAAMWRWVLSVAVAAVLLVALVIVVVRLDADRSTGALVAAVVTAVLAVAAVVVTWLESRRINRHLNRTIERLIDTETELRLLLDDLPEAVVSLDADGGGARGEREGGRARRPPGLGPRRGPVRRARRPSPGRRPRRLARDGPHGPAGGARHVAAPPHRRCGDDARRGDRRPTAPDRRRRHRAAA
jgi:hypothetical protein